MYIIETFQRQHDRMLQKHFSCNELKHRRHTGTYRRYHFPCQGSSGTDEHWEERDFV